MSNTSYKTFNEWKSIGRFVRQGEKSTTRNDKGESIFSFDQTEEKYMTYGRCSRGDCWNNPYYEDEDFAQEMDEILGSFFDQC